MHVRARTPQSVCPKARPSFLKRFPNAYAAFHRTLTGPELRFLQSASVIAVIVRFPWVQQERSCKAQSHPSKRRKLASHKSGRRCKIRTSQASDPNAETDLLVPTEA